MALVPQLDQHRGQSLIMTPKLQQATKLLQLSNLELSKFVEREVEQNPLLEREDTDEHSGGAGTPQDDCAEATNIASSGKDCNMNGDIENFVVADSFNLDSTFKDAPSEVDSRELVEKNSIYLNHEASLNAD